MVLGQKYRLLMFIGGIQVTVAAIRQQLEAAVLEQTKLVCSRTHRFWLISCLTAVSARNQVQLSTVWMPDWMDSCAHAARLQCSKGVVLGQGLFRSGFLAIWPGLGVPARYASQDGHAASELRPGLSDHDQWDWCNFRIQEPIGAESRLLENSWNLYSTREEYLSDVFYCRCLRPMDVTCDPDLLPIIWGCVKANFWILY